MTGESPVFRLVVIDDNPSDIVLLQEAIRESGHSIEMIPFTGATQALAVLPTMAPVDLILSDINMPLMNGFELAERLHAIPDLRTASVVLMSGGVDLELSTAVHRRSRDVAYIRKGVTWSDFRAIVDALHRRMSAKRAEALREPSGQGANRSIGD